MMPASGMASAKIGMSRAITCLSMEAPGAEGFAHPTEVRASA
jgi:hypothetical protein